MEPQTEGMAIASVLIGLLSWIIACCGGLLFPLLGFGAAPFALIGTVLGIMSFRKINAEPEIWSGAPLAIVGIALNVLQLLAALAMGVMMVAGVGLVMLDSSGAF